MTPDDLRQQIELAVVEILRKKLTDGTMTEARSQEISKAVLQMIQPGMNFDELYKIIPKLDDYFPELSSVVLPLIRDYEENVTKQATANVSELIKQGQFDPAAKLGKNVIETNVHLVWHGQANASQ